MRLLRLHGNVILSLVFAFWSNGFIESGVVVGNNVTIKNGNMIWEGVTLEDGMFVGPHVFSRTIFIQDPHDSLRLRGGTAVVDGFYLLS